MHLVVRAALVASGAFACLAHTGAAQQQPATLSGHVTSAFRHPPQPGHRPRAGAQCRRHDAVGRELHVGHSRRPRSTRPRDGGGARGRLQAVHRARHPHRWHPDPGFQARGQSAPARRARRDRRRHGVGSGEARHRPEHRRLDRHRAQQRVQCRERARGQGPERERHVELRRSRARRRRSRSAGRPPSRPSATASR